MVQRLGNPKWPLSFLCNFFVRPLCAGSFAGFWQRWNPPFIYVCLFYVYRPLRLILPRTIATLVTFLVSGFVLHELPFGDGIAIVSGSLKVPKVALLLAIFGCLALISSALRLDFTDRPAWVRAGSNLLLLASGFAIR
jgi:hypothetical protein